MAAQVPSPRDALAVILRAALTCPASLAPVSLEILPHALKLDADSEETCDLALGVLAAVLYARPDLVEDSLLDRLPDLLQAELLPEGIGRAVVKVFEFLASSPAAPRAWALVSGMLRDERLGAGTRELLIPLVRDFVQWREDLVGLDGVLTLAESPTLAGHRAFLLDYGVERFVFSAPETFTEARLERIATLFEHAPRYRYFLYSLAARRRLEPEVRALLASRLAGRFPFQETAATILRGRPLKLLVTLNIGMGQGDDVVRLAPLLQALLDANPALAITLVTRRTYLYDNPRVTPISVDDDAAVQATLGDQFDGVVEFFEPGWVEFAYRPELHSAIERVLVKRRPAFVIKAELGRVPKGNLGVRSQFLYQTVELGGRDIARSCRLDRVGLRNIYEPCMRLIAELGLPQRAAEEPPLTPSLLTGVGSADAERAWKDLISQDKADARRRVVLLNPFGGSKPTKGFLEQSELLAAEIAGLVDEGYLVVLLANGAPWASQSAISMTLSRLDPEIRAHVRLAPDPAEPDAAARIELLERQDLKYEDRVVRLFKYFATYADLVVTVEGWMTHLAYNLGRPFRLFLAASSFSFDWYPHGRGRAQRLVATLSPRSRVTYSDSGLLGEGGPPPIPHRPRKTLLELGLAGLGRSDSPEAVAPLRRALASADYEVRTWAVAALGRIAPLEATRADLLGALDDREPTVVREAADALLRGLVDCSRELGPRYRERLHVCADIARHNWDAVGQVGPVALPALFRAAKSENYAVRRGARLLLRQMLSGYVPQLPPESRAAC